MPSGEPLGTTLVEVVRAYGLEVVGKGAQVREEQLLGLDLNTNLRGYYYLCVVATAVAVYTAARLRRTRTALLAARAATEPAVARRVAAAMAPDLGWDEADIDAATAAFLAEAAAEGIVLGPDAVGATA